MAAIEGPGMFWVASRISKSSESILDEATFLKWYDEDHIPEIVATDGMRNAFRYVDVNKGSSSEKPFLAFYPMPDLAFTQGETFRNFRVKSDILPGSGIIWDLTDMEYSFLTLEGQTEAKNKKAPAQYLLVSAIEPANGTSDKEVQKFYEQQTASISQEPNYLRTLRLKQAVTEPHSWKAVHEFSKEPASTTREKLEEISNDVLGSAQKSELRVYKLARVHGGGQCFDHGLVQNRSARS